MNKTEKKIEKFCKDNADSDNLHDIYEQAKEMIPQEHRRGYRYNEYIDIIKKALKI